MCCKLSDAGCRLTFAFRCGVFVVVRCFEFPCFVGRCSLCVEGCSLLGVCCLLRGVGGALFIVRGLLAVDSCLS